MLAVFRVLRAVGAGLGAAIAVAVAYAVVDLYLSGHGVAVPVMRGSPLDRWVAQVLLVVAPLVVAATVFRRDRPGS